MIFFDCVPSNVQLDNSSLVAYKYPFIFFNSAISISAFFLDKLGDPISKEYIKLLSGTFPL